MPQTNALGSTCESARPSGPTDVPTRTKTCPDQAVNLTTPRSTYPHQETPQSLCEPLMEVKRFESTRDSQKAWTGSCVHRRLTRRMEPALADWSALEMTSSSSACLRFSGLISGNAWRRLLRSSAIGKSRCTQHATGHSALVNIIIIINQSIILDWINTKTRSIYERLIPPPTAM
jgi:hypothetical protein